MDFKKFLLESIDDLELVDAYMRLQMGQSINQKYMEEPIAIFFDDSSRSDQEATSLKGRLLYFLLKKSKNNPDIYLDQSFCFIVAETNLKNLKDAGVTFIGTQSKREIGKILIPNWSSSAKIITNSYLTVLFRLYEMKSPPLSGKALELALSGAKKDDVLLSMIPAPEVDYRSNEMTPEDFY